MGILTVLVFFWGGLAVVAGLTGEGLPAMGLYAMYHDATIGLGCAFLLSLWFTGRFAEKSILRNQKILRVSAKYSFTTNVFIWTVFIIIRSVDKFDFVFGLIFPLIFFSFATITSIFTVGLLICYVIRKRVTSL